ncbi:hypothetical protein L226DRAFT_573247 [Lentinus tigrinus ALCF2SS1-7]|uniref:Uncharacterized protein n=1 Tax=Lentinus tigrinus ALCF2SS1-6 TaxID=1328759 RepID=A0A5C2S3E9_9APHY|nr:hypothetical protein L227DRAFT_613197 [Lentinus tigrinus ALCF2SS1-6]RPD72178.1 hypothetical protein L226DRAFT_573247 [Lentinus tigrinus ALCF2SS1-7]
MPPEGASESGPDATCPGEFDPLGSSQVIAHPVGVEDHALHGQGHAPGGSPGHKRPELFEPLSPSNIDERYEFTMETLEKLYTNSIALLKGSLRISVNRTIFDANTAHMDDKIAAKLNDIEVNVRAARNAMARGYTSGGRKTFRFAMPPPVDAANCTEWNSHASTARPSSEEGQKALQLFHKEVSPHPPLLLESSLPNIFTLPPPLSNFYQQTTGNSADSDAISVITADDTTASSADNCEVPGFVGDRDSSGCTYELEPRSLFTMGFILRACGLEYQDDKHGLAHRGRLLASLLLLIGLAVFLAMYFGQQAPHEADHPIWEEWRAF